MNLISFSLWGSDPKYTTGAFKNCELAKTLYPGWTCVFFVDDLLSPTAGVLRETGAITLTFPSFHVGRYYWRHCVPDVFWRGIDYYVVRDCDSRLNKREKGAVDEWIASGKDFHLMRDHPRHDIAWMQGMYGVKGYALRGITLMMQTVPDVYAGVNPWSQQFYEQLNPNRVLEHGEFNMDKFPNQKPFPVERDGMRFVGEIFDANDEYNNDWKELPCAKNQL